MVNCFQFRLQAADLQKEKKSPIQSEQKIKNDDFYLDSRGLEVWQILKEIGDFYNVTVLAYDDIKNKNIHCAISGNGLKNTLDSIAWSLGVEWIEKDNIYYVGGNSQQVFVMDSAGVDPSIQQVFPRGQVRLVGDKLVIAGTEAEVTKIKEAILYITDRQFCLVHLYGIEISYDKDLELGVEIEKSIQYFLSAENFLLNGFDPTSHIAMSLVASVQAQSSMLDVSTLIDSDIGLISGNQAILNMGEDIDRPLYSSSTYGDRVAQSYNTQHSGLIIKLTGFKANDCWFFKTYIENSESKTDLKKTLNSVENFVQIKGNRKVLIARLNLGTVKKEYTKGIPFLADIPLLGYFFRVTRERLLKKKIYFILEMKDSSKVSLPAPKQFNLPLIDSSNALYDSLDSDSKKTDKKAKK
jgi:hypothetical protein